MRIAHNIRKDGKIFQVKLIPLMMATLLAAACLTARPQVVDLVSFDTDYNAAGGKLNISWETASESDIAGYNVYRSSSYGSLGTRVNSSIIMAQGSPTTGSTYDLIDEPAASGRYYYQLAEVSLSSGKESYSRPSADGDGEADYDDFIKVYVDEESVIGGEYFWFNEGGADPGDGRKVCVIVTSTGISGAMTVRQTNAAPANAPNVNVCPWRWEITSDVYAYSSIDFFYNPADIAGTAETSDYIGLARYDAATSTWTWLGGEVYSGEHKIRLDDVIADGYYALYRRIFGDITGDGYVDLDDFQLFGDVWNRTATGEFSSGSNEYFFNYSKTLENGKQIIDLDDFQIFGDVWNTGTPK
ncbi:hypothetical protein JW998_07820 [candidate division KSB1 bacterium]|nr:hypothetical protein [candidate division KSB1 bacterium]